MVEQCCCGDRRRSVAVVGLQRKCAHAQEDRVSAIAAGATGTNEANR